MRVRITQVMMFAVLAWSSCLSATIVSAQNNANQNSHKQPVNEQPEDWKTQRNELADKLLPSRGITNKRVLEAMRSVPRHRFVPTGKESASYRFGNIDIGHGQVIGDPYIVAAMTQALDPKPNERILEIGTGSGYQAAVLATLAKKVYSIEIVENLAKTAKERLKQLGVNNIETKIGDGYKGWKEYAPFDAIIVTSFPDHVPQELLKQLKPKGRMVLPVGGSVNRMQRIERTANGFKTENLNLAGLVVTPESN